MNVRQAAKRLGLSPRTVERRIAAGKLRAVRDGGCTIIEDVDLAAYIVQRQPWTARRPCVRGVTVPEIFPGFAKEA